MEKVDLVIIFHSKIADSVKKSFCADLEHVFLIYEKKISQREVLWVGECVYSFELRQSKPMLLIICLSHSRQSVMEIIVKGSNNEII